MATPVKVTPIGGINSDLDPLYINGGDYEYALNVGSVADESGNSLGVEPRKGSEFVFDLGSVDRQDKKVRIYGLQGSGSTLNYEATFYDLNSNIVVTASWVSGATSIDTRSNAKSAIESAFSNAIVSHADIDGIDFEILDFAIGTDWIIKSTGTTEFSILTLNEAYSTDLTGKLNIVGSYDLLGELFIWSTTQTKTPSKISIASVSTSTPIRVTSSGHGLTTGENITISGVIGASEANGNWIIDVVTPDTFDLIGSVAGGVYVQHGEITINQKGMGEIGVAIKNNNTNQWEYTRLLRSKELNLVSTNFLDARCESDSYKKSLYFTDYYNIPRAIYYYGIYQQDGCINYISPENIYNYDGINEQSRLVLGEPKVNISVTQNQTDGFLETGNYRYAIRFGTDNLTFTNWSTLTNPIPVFEGNVETLSGGQFWGSDILKTTQKANIITVSNFPTGAYRYIELAAIHYQSEITFSGLIVARKEISFSDTSAEITHYGDEVDSTQLSLNTLNTSIAGIRKAQNIELLDNRLVLSKIELAYDEDLTEFAQLINYRILRKELPSIGYLQDTIAYNNLSVNEYALPNNIVNNTGYKHKEIYRFGVEVKWKGAGWSKAYHIDDIEITTGTTSRRIQGLPDFSLTNETTTNIYVPYIQFANIDLDFILNDGTTLRSKIEDLRFVRAELEPQVLYSGVLVLADGDNLNFKNNNTFYTDENGTYSGSDRKYAVFVSPDISYTTPFNYEYKVGDKVRVFGNSKIANYYQDDVTIPLTTTKYYRIGDYSGYVSGNPTSEHLLVGAFANSQRDGVAISIFSATDIFSGGTILDYGIYHAQYIRPKENLYGAAELTQYITTGTQTVNISDLSNNSTIDVFGGDVFTQKTYLRTDSRPNGGDPIYTGIGVYSQNRRNTQLKYEGGLPFSTYLLSNFNLNHNYLETVTDPLGCSSVWTPSNKIQSKLGFNANFKENKNALTRLYYSELKPQGAFSDNYRVILSLNFKDEDLANGAIEEMRTLNGELFTWQPRSFRKQYFNTRGALTTNDGSEVVIGDGGVLSRPSLRVSYYGTKHKKSVVVGRSKGGNDTAYWINTEYKKLVRFGSDGTNPIGDKGTMAFFANNLSLVDQYTSTGQYGINGVFLNRFGEAIITVRAINNSYGSWKSGKDYELGDFIVIPNSTLKNNYEDIPTIFECIEEHSASSGNKPGVGLGWGSKWRMTKTSESKYYNFYTVAFSEYKDKVSHYYSFRPNIYLPYRNSFLTPNVKTETSKVFEHNRGKYLRWYENDLPTLVDEITFISGSNIINSTSPLSNNFLSVFINLNYCTYYISDGTNWYKVISVESNDRLTIETPALNTINVVDGEVKEYLQEEGRITAILNYEPNINKHYLATQFNSQLAPYRIEFETDNHESFLNRGEFESREDLHYCEIKNDSKKLGITTGDTSGLFGKYLRISFIYKSLEYNKLLNFVIKVKESFRTYKK